MKSNWQTVMVDEYRVRNERDGEEIACSSFEDADKRLSIEREKHPRDTIIMIAVIDG